MPGAAIDIDFTRSLFYGTSLGGLTTTRASTGYADDTAGNWTSFPSNTPRITNKGLLVEEARTNSIRNNSMQGAVAGTPGTAPTNWSMGTGGGLTRTVSGPGTSNGIDYIDIRYVGTTSDTGFYIYFEAAGQATSAQNQVWTNSMFLALVAGSITNLGALRPHFVTRPSGTEQFGTDVKSSLTSTLQRFSNAVTLSNVTDTSTQPALLITYASGVALDFTLRIGWPQLELGAFATSPIRTTSAAATRAADAVSLALPAIGAAYTLFEQSTPQAPTSFATNQQILQVDAGSANDRSFIARASGTGAIFGSVTAGGSTLGSPAGAARAQSASGKSALAVASGDQALSVSGGATIATTGAGLPATPTTMRVGSTSGGAFQSNAYHQRVALFNSRLPNAQLQALTT